MEYISRTVESRPNLSQEEALTSLQSHPQFKAGTKISSIRLRKDRWVAQLLEPKVAEFPPSKDEDDDEEETPEVKLEAPDDGPSADDDGNGDEDSPEPESPFGDGEEKEPKLEAKGELGEVLNLLHQVVEALGIGGPDQGLGLDEVPTDGPPAPPHKGPGRPPGPGGATPGPKPAGPAARPVRDVPPGASPMAGFASRVPSFTAETSEPMTIKEAKADLEETYKGYKVKQIKREAGTIKALLANR